MARHIALTDTDTDETIKEKVDVFKGDLAEIRQADNDKKLAGGNGAPKTGVSGEQASTMIAELAAESPFAVNKTEKK